MAQRGEEPKPGDMIEISRTIYAHWALYVGDGYVVHLAPPSEYPGAGCSSLFSVLSNRAVVKRELLTEVAGNCPYRVNNYLDDKYLPLPVPQIIKAAKKYLDLELCYSVSSRNCEHFVTSLRYGNAHSEQVEAMWNAVSEVLGLEFLVDNDHSIMKRGEEPKPGDMIEISRAESAHWALYMGYGFVVHLVSLSEDHGAGSSRLFSLKCLGSVVKRELLKDVAGDCPFKVNNYLDDKRPPLPVRQIISAAKEMVGRKLRYNVSSSNCEHFVTSLRYGNAHSKQTPPQRDPSAFPAHRQAQVKTLETTTILIMLFGLLGTICYSIMK